MNKFLEENINVQIPRNGPQWEVYYVEDYNQNESLFLWKIHHCMYDGLGKK